MRLSALRKRAVELQIDPAAVDDAMDSEDPRYTMGELVWQAEEAAEAAYNSTHEVETRRVAAMLAESRAEAVEAAETSRDSQEEALSHVVGVDGSFATLHTSPPKDIGHHSATPSGAEASTAIAGCDENGGEFGEFSPGSIAGTELSFGGGADDSGWLEAAEAAVAAGLEGSPLTAAVTAGVVYVRPRTSTSSCPPLPDPADPQMQLVLAAGAGPAAAPAMQSNAARPPASGWDFVR
jgi:hypothetical protein